MMIPNLQDFSLSESIRACVNIKNRVYSFSGDLGPWEIRIFINQPVVDPLKSNMVVDGGEVLNLRKVSNGNYLAEVSAFSETRIISITMVDVIGKACYIGFIANTLTAVLRTGKLSVTKIYTWQIYAICRDTNR